MVRHVLTSLSTRSLTKLRKVPLLLAMVRSLVTTILKCYWAEFKHTHLNPALQEVTESPLGNSSRYMVCHLHLCLLSCIGCNLQ